uniref:Uncharacterized protein n=1 Tax=Knufia peltigerae TaxID=1002370 RepID=A0AA38XXM0_9EURO|nr:hypothetical protein H2204_009744 [Knufia peltigerae]
MPHSLARPPAAWLRRGRKLLPYLRGLYLLYLLTGSVFLNTPLFDQVQSQAAQIHDDHPACWVPASSWMASAGNGIWPAPTSGSMVGLRCCQPLRRPASVAPPTDSKAASSRDESAYNALPYPVAAQQEIHHECPQAGSRSSGLGHRHASGCRAGRPRLDLGSRLLRRPHLACMGTACQRVWPGVDGAIRADGIGRVAGLAPRRMARGHACAGALPAAAGAQCVVELAVLRLEAGGAGVCGHPAVAGADRGHGGRLPSRAPGSGVAAAALPGMGGLRQRAQLRGVAGQLDCALAGHGLQSVWRLPPLTQRAAPEGLLTAAGRAAQHPCGRGAHKPIAFLRLEHQLAGQAARHQRIEMDDAATAGILKCIDIQQVKTTVVRCGERRAKRRGRWLQVHVDASQNKEPRL